MIIGDLNQQPRARQNIPIIFHTHTHTHTHTYFQRLAEQRLSCNWRWHEFTLPNSVHRPVHLRGGADKSLARLGRKQATATKLGTYSKYSTRSSIHFLARCSNFCKPLKKKIKMLSVQPGLRGSNNLRVGRKMARYQMFFQSREQVVVWWGQIQRIGWVIKTLEAQVGHFLLGLQVPSALSCKNKAPLVTFPRRFSFKISFNCTRRGE